MTPQIKSYLETVRAAVPKELKATRQWVTWRLVQREDQEPSKIPFVAERASQPASSTEPNDWTSWGAAYRAMAQTDDTQPQPAGLGFVFAQGDDFVGIDLDDCLNPDTQELTEWAIPIVADFRDTYAEVSPSGTGIKIWAKGSLPTENTGSQLPLLDNSGVKIGAIEMYQRGRYFTVTGQRWAEHPKSVVDCQAAIVELWKQIEKRPGTTSAVVPTTGSHNNELLESCRRAINALPPAISGQGGHNATFFAACEICRWGLQDEQALHVLSEYNQRCEPPWTSKELEHKLHDAKEKVTAAGEFGSRQEGATKNGRNNSEGSPAAIIKSVIDAGSELWHDQYGKPWITHTFNDRVEHQEIPSQGFRDTLVIRNFNAGRSPIGSTVMESTIETLAALARAKSSPEYPTPLRVARHEGRVYLDLNNEQKEVVEITTNGWRIVTDCPVRFVRNATMKSLQLPQRGGDLKSLRQFINIRDEQWPLLLGWILAAMKPEGPYPILMLTGPAGSAKSTAARLLHQLCDPNAVKLLAPTTNEEQMVLAALNNHLICYDNLKQIGFDFSNSLCRLSTGAGMLKRQLYTNTEVISADITRPVILTGIGQIATTDDLLERCIQLELSPIQSKQRRMEKYIYADFDNALPQLLGCLCDAVSAALSNENRPQRAEQIRLADTQHWVEGAEAELGLDTGSFATAMANNLSSHRETILGSSSVFKALEQVLQSRGSFTGNYAELLQALRGTGVDRNFPNTAVGLSSELQRLSSSLPDAGILMEDQGKNNKGRKIVIKRLALDSNEIRSNSSLQDGETSTVVTCGNEPVKPVPYHRKNLAASLPAIHEDEY